jgi:hypothetical protein
VQPFLRDDGRHRRHQGLVLASLPSNEARRAASSLDGLAAFRLVVRRAGAELDRDGGNQARVRITLGHLESGISHQQVGVFEALSDDGEFTLERPFELSEKADLLLAHGGIAMPQQAFRRFQGGTVAEGRESVDQLAFEKV